MFSLLGRFEDVWSFVNLIGICLEKYVEVGFFCFFERFF